MAYKLVIRLFLLVKKAIIYENVVLLFRPKKEVKNARIRTQ